MTNGTERPEDIAVQAGEYVLGVMTETERIAFEARIAADPVIQRIVARERERFLELDIAVSAAPTDGALWQRIESSIEAQGSNVVDLGAERARQRPPAPARTARPPRSGFWSGFAAAGILAFIASGLAYMLVAPQQPRLIVVLLNDQAQPVSIVETLDGQRVRVIPLTAIDVPANRTLQVWTLPDPATGPVSLGLLEQVRATLLEGPTLPTPKLDQLYEITVEPAGGSPTGRPTGPIVGKGYARSPRI